MSTGPEPIDLEQFRRRRRRQARDRRMLNNLPLAHRIAAERAAEADTDPPQGGTLFDADGRSAGALLGQAMVGLVEAADTFERDAPVDRFGAYAAPRIVSALERRPDPSEVARAQAQVAAAIASQERVHQLAGFLQVPVSALVSGLMDATADDPHLGGPPRPFLGAA